MQELPEERFDPLGSHNKSHESVDLFSFSNEALNGSNMENNGFDFSQSQPPAVENGFASDPFSQTELKVKKDESFEKFETTFQESGSKLEVNQSFFSFFFFFIFIFCFIPLYDLMCI